MKRPCANTKLKIVSHGCGLIDNEVSLGPGPGYQQIHVIVRGPRNVGWNIVGYKGVPYGCRSHKLASSGAISSFKQTVCPREDHVRVSQLCGAAATDEPAGDPATTTAAALRREVPDLAQEARMLSLCYEQASSVAPVTFRLKSRVITMFNFEARRRRAAAWQHAQLVLSYGRMWPTLCLFLQWKCCQEVRSLTSCCSPKSWSEKQLSVDKYSY